MWTAARYTRMELRERLELTSCGYSPRSTPVYSFFNSNPGSFNPGCLFYLILQPSACMNPRFPLQQAATRSIHIGSTVCTDRLTCRRRNRSSQAGPRMRPWRNEGAFGIPFMGNAGLSIMRTTRDGCSPESREK